jgi:hypothetical protein
MHQPAPDNPPIMDGPWRLFSHDPQTGETVWVMFDGEKTVVRTDTPIDATIEANQQARHEVGKFSKGDYNRVASIPSHLLHTTGFQEAFMQDDKKWLSRFLNDPDNRAFRTTEGRV